MAATTLEHVSPLHDYDFLMKSFTIEMEHPFLDFRYIDFDIQRLACPPSGPLDSSSIQYAAIVTIPGTNTLNTEKTWIAELESTSRSSINTFSMRGGSPRKAALCGALVWGIRHCDDVVTSFEEGSSVWIVDCCTEWDRRRVAL